MPPIAVLALWALVVWNRDGWRGRARAGALAAGPAVGIVLVYSLVATSIGDYSGMGEMRGWSLYQRVGQFADCSKFTPPDGTAGLCDPRPPASREGPFYYYFSLDAPARKVFPSMGPEDDDEVGAFARAAIVNQPLDYARAVAKDVVRFFDPWAGADRPLSGTDPSSMSFHNGPGDPASAEKVEVQYDGFDDTPDAATSLLETYGAVFRLSGFLLLALFVLSGIAVFAAPRNTRSAVVLCTACAVVLLVVPAAASSYDARYAIPPAALLTVPAAAGIAVLARRL